MNTRFTLAEVAQFCYENRGKKIYREEPFEYFARIVVSASSYDRLYTVAEGCVLVACCVATAYPEKKQLWINHIFSKGNGLATLVAAARTRFPDFKILGERPTGDKLYNLNKLWATLVN